MRKKRQNRYEEYKELLLPEKFESDQKIVEKFLSPILYRLNLIKLVCPMTIEKCFPALSDYDYYIGHLLEHKLFKFDKNALSPEFLKDLEDTTAFVDNSYIKAIVAAKRTRNDHAYYRLRRLENTILPLFKNVLAMEGAFTYSTNDDEWNQVDVVLNSAIYANLCEITEKSYSLNSMIMGLYEEYSRLTRIDCLKIPKVKLDDLWDKAIPYIENPVSSRTTYYYVFGDKSLPDHENPRVILWNGASASLREHIKELFDGESCRWTQLEKCNIFRIKKKDKYVVPSYNSFRNYYSKNKLP